jgi:pimeloyl-ACP methyl ester carboxylesterase
VIQEGPSVSKELIPQKLVYLDVLPPPHSDDRKALLGDNPPKLSILGLIREMTYRVVSGTAFAFQRFLHTKIAIPVFMFGMVFLNITGLQPVKDIDKKTVQERRPRLSLQRLIWMMYPYYNIFNGSLRAFRGMYRLPKLSREMPILFMYGTEKNVMFHDPAGIKVLEEHGSKFDSEAVRVEEAGHWLFLHQAKICRDKISDFIFGAS